MGYLCDISNFSQQFRIFSIGGHFVTIVYLWIISVSDHAISG